jgi:hypothetical protein
MRALLLTVAMVLLVALLAAPAFAAQPNQSCEEQPSGPPGFNSGGFANAQGKYAGAQDQNSKNPKSVSQYDVACQKVSQH